MVKVTISGGGQLKGSETDVIQSFVINDLDFVGILDQLVD